MLDADSTFEQATVLRTSCSSGGRSFTATAWIQAFVDSWAC